MRKNLGLVVAVFGSTLTVLSLTGSTRATATLSNSLTDPASSADVLVLHHRGQALYSAGKYSEARVEFIAAATLAAHHSDLWAASVNWRNVGNCELVRLDFRDALTDFLKAEQLGRASRQSVPLGAAMNNLADLYLDMGNPAAAMLVAREALATVAGVPRPDIRAKLQFQLASALARLHRFPEALVFYRQAIDELDQEGDFDATARILGALGIDALDADAVDDADSALTEALRLVRIHRLTASPNILRGLAKVRARQGDLRSAAMLFESAIAAPQSFLPAWVLYADRGEFWLAHDNLPAALSDFRNARRLAAVLRADIVPADQDRVKIENGLSRVEAGLVDAGNRLALRATDAALLSETFDAAEQDRLWSLRALMPAPDDWRTRLPGTYWDRLARYQTVERKILALPDSSPETKSLTKTASLLSLELQQLEAQAGADQAGLTKFPGNTTLSPLHSAQALLDSDSVLLSFHLTKRTGWVWAVDQRGVNVYPIPALDELQSAVSAFATAIRIGTPEANARGHKLYSQLFGAMPAAFLSHKHWLLELDGPLFDLPFAALPVSTETPPVYLIERASLQAIPGALMPRRTTAPGNQTFLGIGDAIYNPADLRFTGKRSGSANPREGISLPRLPATADELSACSRVWGSSRFRLLTGEAAGLAGVQAALALDPAIIHFATHVVTGPGDEFSSGLIALSLDKSGAMGLLGPRGIVTHPVTASLVVLNGCHSAQGATLPATGLMGLTRAWIGAGAESVLATRWDIPDAASQDFIITFYRELHAHWELGPAFALQRAQLALLKSGASNKLSLLGAYFLLGRA